MHQLELFRVCIWAQSCILVFSAFWHRLKNTMILYRFLSVNVALSLGFKLKLLPFPVIFLNTETFKPCLTVIKNLCVQNIWCKHFSHENKLFSKSTKIAFLVSYWDLYYFLQICKISCDTEATDVKQYYQECVCSKENTLLIVFSKENLQADVSTACSRWIVATVCNVKFTALQYVAVWNIAWPLISWEDMIKYKFTVNFL